jgi:hypothetical protein
MDQWLQVIGALMVLAAFAAAQFRVLDPASYPYLLLNVVGSAILAVLAYQDTQAGFLLLEGVWSLVSLWGVIMRVLGKTPAPPRESMGSARDTPARSRE